jgi:hypothetical protein
MKRDEVNQKSGGEDMEKEKPESAKELEAFKAEVEPKVRQTIQKLLDSDDLNDNTKGAKLYLKYYAPALEEVKGPVLSQKVRELIDSHVSKLTRKERED